MVEDEEDFFNIDDEGDDNFLPNDEEVVEEEFDFESETEEEIEDEEIIEPPKKMVKAMGDDSKRDKDDIQDSVEELQGNINSILDTIDMKPEDMFPDPDLLPGLEIEIEHHDYEKDIELIKIESKETLECLANLYLSEDQMKTKNIYKIIKDDSMSLSKLNFSIESAQRALISCMKQLDMGVNDPLMYQAVAMFQKEMRDTIKMAYDIQRKMKDFYKELKTELLEINAGEEGEFEEEDNYTVIGDPKMLNELFEKMKEDPTLLNDMIAHKKNK